TAVGFSCRFNSLVTAMKRVPLLVEVFRSLKTSSPLGKCLLDRNPATFSHSVFQHGGRAGRTESLQVVPDTRLRQPFGYWRPRHGYDERREIVALAVRPVPYGGLLNLVHAVFPHSGRNNTATIRASFPKTALNAFSPSVPANCS